MKINKRFWTFLLFFRWTLGFFHICSILNDDTKSSTSFMLQGENMRTGPLILLTFTSLSSADLTAQSRPLPLGIRASREAINSS